MASANRRSLFYSCKSCDANCCKKWTIFVTLEDIKRIKRRTGLQPLTFACFAQIPGWELEIYAKASDFHFYHFAINGKVLQLRREGDECIFLSNTRRCEVYTARPRICMLYPYWFKKSPKGIKLAIDIGYKEVCRIEMNRLQEYLKSNKEKLTKIASLYVKELEEYQTVSHLFNST